MGERNTGDLWGAEARDWAEIQEPTSRPLWAAMLDAVGAGPGVALLDAGCAAGGASVMAVDRGAAVTGVDVAANSVEIAQKRAPGAEIRVGAVGALPFEDARFDAVICVNVIQFVPDAAAGLADLLRVTKPGGRVSVAIFAAPAEVDEDAVFTAIADLLPERPTFPEYRFSTPGELERMMRAAGFRDVAHGAVDTPFVYESAEIGWRGQRSAGSIQEAIDAVGEDRVREAVFDAFARFARPDGTVVLHNMMWFATGPR